MAHGNETSTEQGTPALCASGCGFYGSATTNNMCSKCYLGHLNTTQRASPVEGKKTDAVTAFFRDPVSLQGFVAVVAITSEVPVAEAAPMKVALTRCIACKKKVGLLGFACRCGGTFCSLHRYSDGHACNFDYKKFNQEKIMDQNPLVIASKITKF